MKQKVYNLLILDESGSMEMIKEQTIQGFNEIVQTIKGIEQQFPDQEHYISLVTFNGLGRKTLFWNSPAKELKEINRSFYRPDANTPLLDAIGYSVCRLHADLENVDDYNVLATIFTDGEENASREYNHLSIKKIVEELKQKKWTFTYIGTDHDVEKTALSISIENSMYFRKTSIGLDDAFSRDKVARYNFSHKIGNKGKSGKRYFE